MDWILELPLRWAYRKAGGGGLEWIKKILLGEPTIADFDSGIGRLSFVCGALIYDKPFLAPLFSLSAATRSKYGRKVGLKNLPPFVKFILFH